MMLLTASPTVALEPTKSITAQAPPPVAAWICCTASAVPPSIVLFAPALLAASRLPASISTTMTSLAPLLRASVTPIKPTPPARGRLASCRRFLQGGRYRRARRQQGGRCGERGKLHCCEDRIGGKGFAGSRNAC